jgi:hypothetical protein
MKLNNLFALGFLFSACAHQVDSTRIPASETEARRMEELARKNRSVGDARDFEEVTKDYARKSKSTVTRAKPEVIQAKCTQGYEQSPEAATDTLSNSLSENICGLNWVKAEVKRVVTDSKCQQIGSIETEEQNPHYILPSTPANKAILEVTYEAHTLAICPKD